MKKRFILKIWFPLLRLIFKISNLKLFLLKFRDKFREIVWWFYFITSELASGLVFRDLESRIQVSILDFYFGCIKESRKTLNPRDWNLFFRYISKTVAKELNHFYFRNYRRIVRLMRYPWEPVFHDFLCSGFQDFFLRSSLIFESI